MCSRSLGSEEVYNGTSNSGRHTFDDDDDDDDNDTFPEKDITFESREREREIGRHNDEETERRANTRRLNRTNFAFVT